jgi:beta-N-acetylhexosaminidase
MVMTGHISFPNIDKKWPVTLSDLFLKKMIKEELKYQGLIITDDLDMKAMAKHYDKSEIPIRALEAGADLLLYCNEPESPPVAIAGVVKAIESGRLKLADIEAAHKKVLKAKSEKYGMVNKLTFEQASEIIGHKDHLYIADCLRKQIMPEGVTEM